MVDLLLRRGAEIDLQNKNGDTALIFAAAHHRPAVVLRLLRAGADMTLRDAAGKKERATPSASRPSGRISGRWLRAGARHRRLRQAAQARRRVRVPRPLL